MIRVATITITDYNMKKEWANTSPPPRIAGIYFSKNTIFFKQHGKYTPLVLFEGLLIFERLIYFLESLYGDERYNLKFSKGLRNQMALCRLNKKMKRRKLK
jgi:hypothetical protein